MAQTLGYVPRSILTVPLETDREVLGVIEIFLEHYAARWEDVNGPTGWLALSTPPPTSVQMTTTADESNHTDDYVSLESLSIDG